MSKPLASVKIKEFKDHIQLITDGQKRRAERENDCMQESSDSALSRMAEDNIINLLNEKIEILENGGKSYFKELLHLDGIKTNAKLINTRYGESFMIESENGGNPIWINPNVKESTLKRKGFKIEWLPSYAWCKLKSGNGLTSYVDVFKVDEPVYKID